MKKILVMRYRFIGDTVLTVPFLRNLRYAYPDAQIDMLVSSGSGEILENCPYVNNFIFFDTTKKHKYENGEKKSFWYYVKILRKQRYDKIYVLKRSLSSAILAFCLGAKERIGFDTECRGFLLTKKVPYNKNKHELESFLDVLRADNIKINDTYLEGFIDDDTQKNVDKIFEETGIKNPIVIIHATASTPQKEWVKENWAKIIEYLSNEKNAQIIFLGAKNDAASYREILGLVKEELKIKPVNFCGKFSLTESLAAMKKAGLTVGIDSGNLHMSASVKTRVIGLYSPEKVKKWGAYPCKSGVNILITADSPGTGEKAVKEITFEQVKSQIDKVI